MYKYNIDATFSKLIVSLEEEFEQKKIKAFVPESRPIPEGLIPKGIPLGHIALRGDFEPTEQIILKPKNNRG